MDKNTEQKMREATGNYCAAYCAAERIKRMIQKNDSKIDTEKVLEINIDVILVDLQTIETALLQFKKVMNFEVSDEERIGAAEIAAAEIGANTALDQIDAELNAEARITQDNPPTQEDLNQAAAAAQAAVEALKKADVAQKDADEAQRYADTVRGSQAYDAAKRKADELKELVDAAKIAAVEISAAAQAASEATQP